MKRTLLWIFALLLLARPSLAAFAGSVPITIQCSTKSPQCGTVDTSNFVLKVWVLGGSATADKLKQAPTGFVQSASGYDIRPYSDSGLTPSSALTYQLIYYNPSTGAMEMDVLWSSLAHATDVTFYLDFGDTGLTSDGSSTSAYPNAPSAGGYYTIWHLNSTSVLKDWSQNAIGNLTNHSATNATGEFDGGLTLTRASNHYLDAGNSATVSVTTNFFIGAWVKLTSGGVTQVIASKWNASLAPNGYSWIMYVDTSNQLNCVVSRDGGATTPTFTTGGTALSTGTWYWLGCSVDTTGGVTVAYVNGASDGTGSQGAGALYNVTGQNALIGQNESTNYLNATIDEVAIVGNYNTISWLTAIYNNQRPSADLLSYSACTGCSGGGGGAGDGQPSPSGLLMLNSGN